MLKQRMRLFVVAALVTTGCALGGTARQADGSAASTGGNAVVTWDEAAANTVVKSGAFQNEGLVYMAYVASAVYQAVQWTPAPASADAAVAKRLTTP